jgi:hypothetical protein
MKLAARQRGARDRRLGEGLIAASRDDRSRVSIGETLDYA